MEITNQCYIPNKLRKIQKNKHKRKYYIVKKIKRRENDKIVKKSHLITIPTCKTWNTFDLHIKNDSLNLKWNNNYNNYREEDDKQSYSDSELYVHKFGFKNLQIHQNKFNEISECKLSQSLNKINSHKNIIIGSLSLSQSLNKINSNKNIIIGSLANVSVAVEDLKYMHKSKLQKMLNGVKVDYRKIYADDYPIKNPELLEKRVLKIELHNIFHFPPRMFLETVKHVKADKLFLNLMKMNYDVQALSKLFNSLYSKSNNYLSSSRENMVKNKSKVDLIKNRTVPIKTTHSKLKRSSKDILNLKKGSFSRTSKNKNIDVASVNKLNNIKDSRLIINASMSRSKLKSNSDLSFKTLKSISKLTIPKKTLDTVKTVKANEYNISNLSSNTASDLCNIEQSYAGQLPNNDFNNNFNLISQPTHIMSMGNIDTRTTGADSIANYLNRHICIIYNSLHLGAMRIENQDIISKVDSSATSKYFKRNNIMLRSSSFQMVDLAKLRNKKSANYDKEDASMGQKSIICMHENGLLKLINRTAFRDLIFSESFRFGIIRTNTHGKTIAQEILYKDSLILMHHSVIEDNLLGGFLAFLTTRNEALSERLKTSVYIPSTTYQFWANVSPNEKYCSEVFKENFGFLSRELRKEQTVHLLKSNQIEHNCSVDTLKIVLKNLHRRLQFSFQRVVLLIGNHLGQISSEDEFYKVETIDRFIEGY